MIPIKYFRFYRLLLPSLWYHNIFNDFHLVFHQPFNRTNQEVSLISVASGKGKQCNIMPDMCCSCHTKYSKYFQQVYIIHCGSCLSMKKIQEFVCNSCRASAEPFPYGQLVPYRKYKCSHLSHFQDVCLILNKLRLSN